MSHYLHFSKVHLAVLKLLRLRMTRVIISLVSYCFASFDCSRLLILFTDLSKVFNLLMKYFLHFSQKVTNALRNISFS